MNYIKHLNGFFQILEQDERMTAYHISLYLSCFRIWNINRFKNPFSICRYEMMRLSRVGSVNTYARCIKQLHEWGYIEYSPSANMHSGSMVSCIRFDITRNPTGDTATDTLLINTTNNKNRSKQVASSNENLKTSKDRLHAKTNKDYSEPL
jgi:hypothetical protein